LYYKQETWLYNIGPTKVFTHFAYASRRAKQGLNNYIDPGTPFLGTRISYITFLINIYLRG